MTTLGHIALLTGHVVQTLLLSQGIFRMIRAVDFANYGTFQKATREIFERYGFLKRALVLIG
jgi:hypothetical protein